LTTCAEGCYGTAVHTPSRYMTYSVPGMSCEHCRTAITAEVSQLAGVESVEIDLEDKLVVVRGDAVDAAVRAAIDVAGYDVFDP
jgi:copper chaperone